MRKIRRIKTAILTALAAGVITVHCHAAAFEDVPADHWAYAAVAQLAKADLIDGYGGGSFRGDRTITRYEMAVLTGKAIDRFQEADAAQQKVIDQLSAEFSGELNRMGVRVAKVEAKTKTWVSGGDMRFRVHTNDPRQRENRSSKLKGSDQYSWRARVRLSGELTDQIRANIRLTSSWSNRPGYVDGVGSTAYFDVANITAQNVLGFDTVKIGRDGQCETGLNLISKGDSTDGIWVKKSLSKATSFNAWTGNTMPSDSHGDANQVTIANLNWQVSDRLKLGGGYYWADIPGTSNAQATGHLLATNGAAYDSSQGYDLSASYKFGGLTLLGEFVGASLKNPVQMGGNPTGWTVQLSNGKGPSAAGGFFGNTPMTDISKKGDSAWLINYRRVESGAIPYSLGGYDGIAVADTKGTYDVFNHGTDNVKGWLLAYEFVPAKNTTINLCYQILSVTDRALTPRLTSDKLDRTFVATLNCYF